MILSAQAPAKINRELRVGARRGDGYHEVFSRLVSIDLADVVEVTAGGGTLELSCTGLAVPSDESNLVARAARALAERLGRAPDARIRLQKRVPVGAGLGGGSSDAARTLELLDELWSARLPRPELADIAASLGSDVPFFLVGGEADVSGRGERVAARPDSEPVELLILVPPVAMSTADVYAAYDRLTPGSGDRRVPAALEVAASKGFFGPNELAFAVLETRPDMGVLLGSAQNVASESAITGSGSAIVLKGAVGNAEERLAALHPGIDVYRCRTLTRAEYRRRTESSGGSQWTSPR